MFCNSTITDLFLFVFTQLILHYLKMLTFSISQNKSLEKYRILSIKNTKLNKVMINLLLSKFTEAQIVKFLKKVSITNKKQFRTIHDYIDSIAKYYHSMI